MTSIDKLLDDTLPPGVYRLQSSIPADELCRRAAAAGARCVYLDGRAIADKASFLAACAQALEFPSYFGHNWDALDELLADLSWLPPAPTVILYDGVATFAAQEPRQWATALDVLRTAAAHWRTTPTPLYVLLRGTRGLAPATPPTQASAPL
jgi:RNAse (barnase) inhibitor barstar